MLFFKKWPMLNLKPCLEIQSPSQWAVCCAHPSHSPIHSQVPVHQSAGRLCTLSGPPGQQRWVGVGVGLAVCWGLSVQYWIFWKVYRIMPKSEVACPKKDSITASNWGRFLPVLQIKSPLKLFVLGGLCPSHQRHPNKTPPSLTNTQTRTVKCTWRGINHH